MVLVKSSSLVPRHPTIRNDATPPKAAKSCCHTCKKSPPEVSLQRCLQCMTTRYCGKECQDTDEESHKEVCRHLGDQARSPRCGLEHPIKKPFTRLQEGTWLHDRPKEDVYRILIDAYRLRSTDDHIAIGRARYPLAIHIQTTIAINGFRGFLTRAESRRGLLPPWWDYRQLNRCAGFGRSRDNPAQFQVLREPVEENEIVQHYRDVQFPLQLRLLAAAVYGCGAGGKDMTDRRRIMAHIESTRYEQDRKSGLAVRWLPS